MATWCLAKECSISVNVKMVTATAFFKEKSINFLVGFMFLPPRVSKEQETTFHL